MADIIPLFPALEMPSGMVKLGENLFAMDVSSMSAQDADRLDKLVSELRKRNYIIPDNWKEPL